MAKRADSAVFRALAEILNGVDYCPTGLDVPDQTMCRAMAAHGGRCGNLVRPPHDRQQFNDLWFKFRNMTECPNTDDFYDELEIFIALTHCKRYHRSTAFHYFALWKANRQAASNSQPVTLSTNETSKNKQHDSSLETLHENRSKESLGSTPLPYKDEAVGRNERSRLDIKIRQRDVEERQNSPSRMKKLRGQGRLLLNRLTGKMKTSTASPEESANIAGPRVEWGPTLESISTLPETNSYVNTKTKVGDGYADKIPDKLLDMTQETPINVIAPPTDSGYGSTYAAESKTGVSMEHTDIAQSTQEITDQEISDTATQYSDESRTTVSKKQGYIWELANELFKNISSIRADNITQARISNILPELLQAFALKVGYDAKTQMHRDVMAFVHRHRR